MPKSFGASLNIQMEFGGIVRRSLWVTAPFNLVAAFGFAFPSSSLGTLIQLPQAHAFYTFFSGALVGLFGLTYIWMALQPALVRPLLFVGACGKALAVLLSMLLFVSGQLSGVTAAIISGDLVFVALWFSYLYKANAPSDGDAG